MDLSRRSRAGCPGQFARRALRKPEYWPPLVAPGDKRAISKFRFRFPVLQWASRAIENDPARRAQHRVPRRRVPFHGLAETRIDVGVALGDHAEFEGGTQPAAP